MRHEQRGDWRPLAFYAAVSVAVVLVGVLVLWGFFERQSLQERIAAEPLPKVNVVAATSDSRYCAAWVSLLTENGFDATLVAVPAFEATGALTALCDLGADEQLLARLGAALRRGGGLVLLGNVSGISFGSDRVTTSSEVSAGALRVAEAPAPVLARVQPGYEIGARSVPVAVVKERTDMSVDARWSQTSKAAIAHFPLAGGRALWLGIDPGALHVTADRQLGLLLRASFRWTAGQPVSDGASGTLSAARELTAAARLAARANRLAFSVDRLDEKGWFSLRIANRGKSPLTNPTVKVWLPPGVRRAEMRGSLLARRGVTIDYLPAENAALVTINRLGPQRERLLKIVAE